MTRDWNEPHFLFLTLHRAPEHGEEIMLELQGQPVPRDQFNILHNADTGEVHVFKREATWGDCATASVRFQKKARAA